MVAEWSKTLVQIPTAMSPLTYVVDVFKVELFISYYHHYIRNIKV